MFVAGEFRARLQATFTQELSDVAGEWSLENDPAEAQNLLFHYPSVLASPGEYVVKAVKMEFGGRSDHWPSERCTLRAYVAAEFPAVFKAPEVSVQALSPVRTFWEKATILHSEYHRTHPDLGEKKRSARARSSRHWYDLMRMAGDEALCERALADVSLLDAVAAHKALFYKDPKSRYQEARRGSLRLVPHPGLEAALREDYTKMEEMFFRPPPTFDEVLSALRSLESRINS